MMRSRLLAGFIAVASLVVLAGCKPSVPDRYIQPDELGDILYDYHLARAMADQGGGDKDMIAYKAAILKKYGYTEAELDSSLYYYVRHTKLMHDVYEQLSDRLGKEALALGASANDINHFGSDGMKGDTANVWTGQRSIVLMTGKATCLSTFEVKVDTSYRAGDKLLLDFNSQFIFQEGMRDGVVVLAVRFANDSVAQQINHISSSSHYSLTVYDDAKLGIKSIKGFFMLNNNASTETTMRIMIIQNIRLIRMHQKPEAPTTPADSTSRPQAPVQMNEVKPIEQSKLQKVS